MCPGVDSASKNEYQDIPGGKDGRSGHVASMGEDRGVHRVLVGKPEGKRPLGRPRHRWEDHIKMDLQEVGGVMGTGWSWLRTGTGGGHLWAR